VSPDRAATGEMKFQHIADVLRMDIVEGKYGVGQRIPTQQDLAKQFGVSRATVQKALAELQDGGWIESRQGSGATVLPRQNGHTRTVTTGRSPMVVLGPYIQAAFESPHVTLDLFTLTAESMDTHVRTQAVRIHTGEIQPQSISMRLLLPSLDIQLAVPRAKDDPDDLRPLERLRGISRRSIDSLRYALTELQLLQLVPAVSVEIKTVAFTPTIKLYLLNGQEALFGLYRVVERPVELEGSMTDIYDVLGMGATLFRHVKDDDPKSRDSVFVDEAQRWFDSLWERLAE
jgi:hypothetical protein